MKDDTGSSPDRGLEELWIAKLSNNSFPIHAVTIAERALYTPDSYRLQCRAFELQSTESAVMAVAVTLMKGHGWHDCYQAAEE